MSTPVAQVIEKLLSGKFICAITDHDSYSTLKDEGLKSKVQMALKLMERKLVMTDRSGAYYAVHTDIAAHNRAQVKKVMTDTHSLLRPVVGFLSLVVEASKVDTVLCAGQEISLPILSAQISGSPSLSEKLDKVYRVPKVKLSRNKETDSDKLAVVFEFLSRHGVIQEVNRTSETFVVTGKIDYFYSLLEYIDSHERVVEQIDQQKHDQGELSF
ncbi:conserved hypothetical protein [Vibrio chagasii]|nr:conserved hypothetical protein [Vibrio chagasii]